MADLHVGGYDKGQYRTRRVISPKVAMSRFLGCSLHTSSGSSLEHLVALSLVMLMMTPTMNRPFVFRFIRPSCVARNNVIRLNWVVCSEWHPAHPTALAIPMQQFPSHLRVRVSGDVALCSLLPVAAEPRVIGTIAPADRDVARNRHRRWFDQLGVPVRKCPVSVVTEVPASDPVAPFVWVAPLGPSPEHLPLAVSDVAERLFGCAMPVVVRPSPNDRVQVREIPTCPARRCVTG
jgi:hypothetical protein